MRAKWDTLLTVTLVLCALTTTALVIRREWGGPQVGAPDTQKPAYIAKWQSLLETGVRSGSRDARVQLIEFADFECSFCATFHRTLTAIRDRYPRDVAISYVHYPLEMHRFAEPAARAAECAGEQGHFEAMHDRLFDEQNKLGLKPWTEFASQAGVPDMGVFEACIKDTSPVARIEAGKALSKKLNIKGTPTLVINGWKLESPPGIQELDGMIRAVLAGNKPT